MKYFIFTVFFILFFTGCSVVQLPKQTVVSSNPATLQSKLLQYPHNRVPYQDIANKSITQVKEGDTNLYGITISKDLKIAYDGYLSGDASSAMEAIKKINATQSDPKILWQASFLKIQNLIVQGLGSDALEEIEICKRYEMEAFNSNLNCTALRAELNVWLENYDDAKKDAGDVLSTIGQWEFPISYPAPPSNMDTLVATTTAQMRAYTSLAALYNLQENYKESYYWANEAEKRINAIHYVSNHWLYGNFVHLHLDSYYGRASNLTFLAASKLALGFPQKEVEADFIRAIKFFEMIDYKKGIATVLTLKARVYNKLGRYETCRVEGEKALEYAIKNGFLDFVWRIEAIRADTFANLGLMSEAKKAYRRAHDTINVLSGALSFESAKREFGIGKEDIAYHLIQFSKQEKNYEQLFIDLETSRARAFVDMLSERMIKLQRDNKLLVEIQKLDQQIQKQTLLNTGIGDQSKGVQKLEKLFKLRGEKSKELQKTEPKLASAVSIWSGSLSQTQSYLKKNESLVYFLPIKNEQNIEYLFITKDTVNIEILQISNKEISRQLSKLLNTLGIETLLSSRALKLNKNSIVKKETIKSEHTIQQTIQQLKNKLQVDQMFSAKKTYIVASGVTHFIPWGMLNTSKEFAILPNGNWLTYKDIKLDTKDEIVIVANPNFGGELPQLDGAYKEGEVLAKLYNTNAMSHDNATYLNVKQALKDGVQTLHLATHGVFYKDKPMQSAIYLSKDGKADPITAKKIYQEPLKANLVVLSACETGLGSSSSGDDLLGLTRSFFLGGTKTVVSSLWPIDDEGTKKFMDIFYQNAKDGKYSKGFLKARQTLQKEGYSPAIYGAFVLNGTDQ